MNRRNKLWLISAMSATMLIIPTLVAVSGGASAQKSVGADTTATAPTSAPQLSKDDRETADELYALADAWHQGGGRYGYPFWEKAYQRWKSKAISASVFREYVTGYRDSLTLGCELIDTVDVNHDASRDVSDLITDACDRRLEALRAQKRELDALIKRESTGAATPIDPEERAKLAGEIAEQHSIVDDKLQQSWRNTRLAMGRAQEQLDALGLKRLDEDVII